MDEKYLEQADALTASIIEAGISKARVNQGIPDGFTGDCACGEEIPLARVAHGFYNCVGCQQKVEDRKKYFRGANPHP